MSLTTFLKNLESAVNKMSDYAKSAQVGQTTIIHPEVYSTEEDAKRGSANLGFRAWHSSKKEFSRRLKGI